MGPKVGRGELGEQVTEPRVVCARTAESVRLGSRRQQTVWGSGRIFGFGSNGRLLKDFKQGE